MSGLRTVEIERLVDSIPHLERDDLIFWVHKLIGTVRNQRLDLARIQRQYNDQKWTTEMLKMKMNDLEKRFPFLFDATTEASSEVMQLAEELWAKDRFNQDGRPLAEAPINDQTYFREKAREMLKG